MSEAPFKILLAQLNLMVGDIGGNKKKIISAIFDATSEHYDIIVFPELSISAYPPEDLLLRPAFIQSVQTALDEIVAVTADICVVIGYPASKREQLYNACSIIHNGNIVETYYKQNLPNYGVFDEKRYFSEGDQNCLFEIRGITAAISICEDVWESQLVKAAAEAGAKVIFNINASPYHENKLDQREAIVSKHAKEANIAIVYCNLVGGQDELVFDGNSFVVDGSGNMLFHAPAFEEGLYEFKLDLKQPKYIQTAVSNIEQSLYNALVLGTRDYIRKNHFNGVLIGLSGGIDSALTLTIAVDAIGAENVEVLIMPSRFTADISNEDACQQAESLNVKYDILSIEQLFESFLNLLGPRFTGLATDITEENIQARCRAILLMAASNKSGKLVLTTGNKSEMAVGYATLYGDMAGAYAPLKDVWKTRVYQLAKWRNRQTPVIPKRVIERAPSAELRHDQVDQDSLPDYQILDSVLTRYIELAQSPKQIIKAGFNTDVVQQVVRLVDRSEYKRKQSAPGVRVTGKAFGRDRRYPVTSGYIEK